jgi:hypothetical protein
MSILNQLTIEKSKIVPYALAILATAAMVWRASSPAEITKVQTRVVTKTVEVVKYKDRVKVVRVVVTKPDGTRIETDTRDETKSGSKTRKDKKDEKRTEVTSRNLPKYSLGINCNVLSCNSLSSYSALVGFRLGNLPLNLELGGGINGILVGVRYDF